MIGNVLQTPVHKSYMKNNCFLTAVCTHHCPVNAHITMAVKFIIFQIGFFQCFSYIIDRLHQNSPSMHFRRANMDSGGPIRIKEGQYGTVYAF